MISTIRKPFHINYIFEILRWLAVLKWWLQDSHELFSYVLCAAIELGI